MERDIYIYFDELIEGRKSADELVKLLVNAVYCTDTQGGEFTCFMVHAFTKEQEEEIYSTIKPFFKPLMDEVKL